MTAIAVGSSISDFTKFFKRVITQLDRFNQCTFSNSFTPTHSITWCYSGPIHKSLPATTTSATLFGWCEFTTFKKENFLNIDLTAPGTRIFSFTLISLSSSCFPYKTIHLATSGILANCFDNRTFIDIVAVADNFRIWGCSPINYWTQPQWPLPQQPAWDPAGAP